MKDIDRALADIAEIRGQLAASTQFRGLAPHAVAATAGLALVAALWQSVRADALARDIATYLIFWAGVAVVATIIVGVEMMTRARQAHGVMAGAMIHGTLLHFLPAATAGIVIWQVLNATMPEALVLVPGISQLLLAIGIFASLTTLPRAMTLAAGWYFAAGTIALLIASKASVPSAWVMGLPFAIGQALSAAILYREQGGRHGR